MMQLFPSCTHLKSMEVLGGGIEVQAMMCTQQQQQQQQQQQHQQPIAPVRFLFQSLTAPAPHRMCWLWIHPAAAAAAVAAASAAASQTNVEMEELTGELQRFRVRGAMATQALDRAFRPSAVSSTTAAAAADAPADAAADVDADSAYFAQWWLGNMAETPGGACAALQLVPDGAVVSGEFEDPRERMPQQIRAKRQVGGGGGSSSSSSSSGGGGSSSRVTTPWHACLSVSSLWSRDSRKAMFDNKQSTGQSRTQEQNRYHVTLTVFQFKSTAVVRTAR
jgi:uncharacterized membrane protein YgcG